MLSPADDRTLPPPRPSTVRTVAVKLARRLLSVAGLTRVADLERARRSVRATERDRAARAADAASARLATLAEKLRAAEERTRAALAQYKMTHGLLRHYLLRLARMESEVVERIAVERRVKRAQIAAGARAARRQPVSPSASAAAARFASLSADYAQAVARCRAGDRPAACQRVEVAGLHWSVPSSTAPDAPSSSVERWLPLDDLATVRQFSVGGVMLDLGAGAGAAVIPRIVLGDFAHAYVTETEAVPYLALVANTLDNHLEGRVLPDRVAICGSARTIRIAAPEGDVQEVPASTLDGWMERLGIAVGDVRFVRIVMQGWNLDALRGAAALLSSRDILWQVEMSPAVLGTAMGRLDDLLRDITAHFTHVRELGRFGAHWQPAEDAAAVLRSFVTDHRAANILLLNLPNAETRKRAASE